MNSSITILEESIIKGNSKLAIAEKVISDLRNKLLDKENKLKSGESVISNLKQEICIKGNKLKEAETEILHLREALLGVADSEKTNVNLANELTNEVKTLKMQSEQEDQIKLDSEQNTIYRTTNRKDSSAVNVRKSDRKKQKERKKKQHTQGDSIGNIQPRCQNPQCVMLLYHTADQCPRITQKCTGCLAKGHHIIDCPQICCQNCGSMTHHKPTDCDAATIFVHTVLCRVIFQLFV